MKLLYGVVGEGMGHATRSRVVIDGLLTRGHEVRIVASGKALPFFRRVFADRARVRVEEIRGLTLKFDGSDLDVGGTLRQNIEGAPVSFLQNLLTFLRLEEEDYRADAVLSDFESWAWFYGLNQRLPVLCIDNMHVLHRCQHPPQVTHGSEADFALARAAVKAKLPGAYHYLITSFFYPPVRKPRTTLVPPILRPEVLGARREPGEHVVVYQTSSSSSDLVSILKRLPGNYRMYGSGRVGSEGNVDLRPFSEIAFVEDLRTAKAVIANSGFSLMSEAVHLGVPMLAVPLAGQFEQELNARWLAELGYGSWTPTLDEGSVDRFLSRLDDHSQQLAAFPRTDNELLFGCIEQVLDCAAADLPPPDRLQGPHRGTWEDPPIPTSSTSDG